MLANLEINIEATPQRRTRRNEIYTKRQGFPRKDGHRTSENQSGKWKWRILPLNGKHLLQVVRFGRKIGEGFLTNIEVWGERHNVSNIFWRPGKDLLSKGRTGSRKTNKVLLIFPPTSWMLRPEDFRKAKAALVSVSSANNDDEALTVSMHNRGRSSHTWLSKLLLLITIFIRLISLPSLLAIVDSAIAAKDARSPPSSKDIFKDFSVKIVDDNYLQLKGKQSRYYWVRKKNEDWIKVSLTLDSQI